jgi:antitoxin (DNA-binding transcriptional repressor) of toxin-antitoxin stability system
MVMITKRGKPAAKLVPVEEETPSLFGRLKGTVTIQGPRRAASGVEDKALPQIRARGSA